MLTGPCPPFPAGAEELVRVVSDRDSWPLVPGASERDAVEWLRARPVRECVGSRRFGRLVGLACVYSVAEDDPSCSVWVAATGLPRGRLLAVGGLLVDPSARFCGVAAALVACALGRVRSFGRVPVAATRLDVSEALLARLGLRDVGLVADASGVPVRALVGV